MRKIVLCLLMGGLGLATAWGEDSGARFSSVSREVEVFPDANPDSRSFADGKSVINVDDHVVTGEDSSAVITFADMSTLMVKAESEIVVALPPDKGGQIDLLKGRLWMNVKKIVAGEAIEVKSNLATTGIKGTIVTFHTQPDGSEDTIQVLRGTAEVTVNATKERTLIEAGQELVVKTGGNADKRDIDVEDATDDWRGELSTLGSAIDLQDIPDTVSRMQDRQGRGFRQLKDTFGALTGPADPRVGEFQKEAGRYLSALFEDDLILDNLDKKVDQAMSSPMEEALQRRMTGTKKAIGEARKNTRTYLSEVGTMVRRFAPAGSLDEIDQARQAMAFIWGEVEKLRQELEGSVSPLSQDWFDRARELVSQRTNELQAVITNLQALQERKPNDETVRATLKQAQKTEAAIQLFLRDLAVPTLDAELVQRMQERSDLMSFEIGNLKSEVDAYTTVAANSQLEDRLRASLSLVRRFSAVKRVSLETQRLYATIQRTSVSRRYRSAEQERMTELYQQIQDQFQELEIVYDDIRAGQELIESQLGGLMK